MEDTEINRNIICFGQYVVFEKKDYKKIHLLSQKNEQIFIGKNKVDLHEVIGKNMGSNFKMIPKVGCNRHFTLQLCSISEMSLTKELLKDLNSGLDNRSICDDGSSQVLTAISIEELRDSGAAPQTIMEHLVENSKTFKIKTEYSQEKYIKKKEKKYFEFITIKRPTIRILAEVFYDREIPKTIGIRIDTLSQISTAINLQPDGKYLLIESGFKGIVAATMLNSLSEEGKIVLVTPGNQCQKQAVLAMNFTNPHLSNLMTLRLKTVLDIMSCCSNLDNISSIKIKENVTGGCDDEMGLTLSTEKAEESDTPNQITSEEEQTMMDLESNQRKRKLEGADTDTMANTGGKKPRWAIEAELARDILLQKVDGLVMACKESSVDILDKLMYNLKPSRPFVIYSQYVEPLVTMYLHLKPRHDIVSLKITETWLRPYQILPERSHPAVTVSSSSGYLLHGIKVRPT